MAAAGRRGRGLAQPSPTASRTRRKTPPSAATDSSISSSITSTLAAHGIILSGRVRKVKCGPSSESTVTAGKRVAGRARVDLCALAPAD